MGGGYKTIVDAFESNEILFRRSNPRLHVDFMPFLALSKLIDLTSRFHFFLHFTF
jgi:hypothetical protein